jgi:hypothetical protein
MRFAAAPLVALLVPACLLAQPVPDSDIPGPFTVYNITGKHKGHYHCQVSENGLNPVVMVVVRGIEPQGDGLKELLNKLDNAIDKNPTTRLAGFVVFLSNTLKDVAKDDKEREALEPKLEDLARGYMLKHLVVCLAEPARLAAWKLDPDADVTVVLYKDLRTVAVHKLTWEQLKQPDKGELPAKVKEILEQVKEKFKTTR